ncbi:putative interactor of constitutively active ROPs [Helianthus annuus]|nr:putative interactor of constitutively active ROPs [Helianthus annuus]KAJ0497617.1 putative interactor of constitutively active ROPs [Helianthus annuus]KAJ0663622.1 putative interactor of constitutively active ROPs [Helianthus annuus]KAJ0671121.1 putative interactor of constitutively active ROPs [Helianthus annuus]
MQTPKTSTKSSSGSEGGRRVSPRSVSSSSDRTSGQVVRQLKTTRLEPPKTPRTTSPKIVDRASPRSHVTELQKNRLGRISELETQVTQLEDALRTVKDQLIVSESWKKQAKIDAEESRKELLALSLRLEESQKLLDQSSSKEARDEQDDDSAALAAALIEIDQLKVKLITTTESEATKTKQAESAEAEIHTLKENIAETLSKMKEMKNQLEDCKVSESKARALATETLQQLEAAKKNMESLSINSDAYNAVVMELQHSRARVRCLEEIVENMKKTEQCSQTMELTAELKKSKEDIEELKANLMDKETELQCVVEENEDLNAKLGNLIAGVQENESKQEVNGLKSKLIIMDTDLCEKSNENETLKLEIKKTDGVMETVKMRSCELEEELRKLKLQMGQWRKAAEVATAMLCDENKDNNGRMVADRAWSMGHYSPRKKMNTTGSPLNMEIDDDNDNDDDDEEFLKRKNGNMLKRIGVLWKKPQNK